jgi:hypothetical protein
MAMSALTLGTLISTISIECNYILIMESLHAVIYVMFYYFLNCITRLLNASCMNELQVVGTA